MGNDCKSQALSQKESLDLNIIYNEMAPNCESVTVGIEKIPEQEGGAFTGIGVLREATPVGLQVNFRVQLYLEFL